jgi:repressor LexA
MELHPHQRNLLNFIRKNKGNIESMSLRGIGKEVGLSDKAQVVAHHLLQLENKGFLRRPDSSRKNFEVLENPASEVVYVDLYRTMAQCGPDGFLGDDTVIERIPLSSKTFGINNPKDFFLIKPRGKSMEPMIKEGDLVLARKQGDVETGQVAVLVHNGMPKIKKVVKIGGSDKKGCLLRSLNTDFEDEEVGEGESDFRICGQVKGIIRVQ